MTEYWNGTLTTVGETYDTTADSGLALTPAYDTEDNFATNTHFSFFSYIKRNKNCFKNRIQ